jgi:hypothetical protein
MEDTERLTEALVVEFLRSRGYTHTNTHTHTHTHTHTYTQTHTCIHTHARRLEGTLAQLQLEVPVTEKGFKKYGNPVNIAVRILINFTALASSPLCAKPFLADSTFIGSHTRSYLASKLGLQEAAQGNEVSPYRPSSSDTLLNIFHSITSPCLFP